MEFETTVRHRRMVRNFNSEPVAPELIDRIVELAQHAPSAGFSQGQAFVVVTRPDLKESIASLCGEQNYVTRGFDPFISCAPVLLIPCVSEAIYHRRYQEPDKLKRDGTEITWPVPYWYMDIGCAVMLALLAAVDAGLAAGYSGVHDLAALRQLLKIPDEVTPMGVIPIGRGAPDKRSPSLKRGRKPMAEFLHREHW